MIDTIEPFVFQAFSYRIMRSFEANIGAVCWGWAAKGYVDGIARKLPRGGRQRDKFREWNKSLRGPERNTLQSTSLEKDFERVS